jgi:DNA processing protein
VCVPPPFDEQLAWIALAQTRLSAEWWRQAVKSTGSALALVQRSDAELAVLGLNGRGIAALRGQSQPEALGRLRDHCLQLDIAIAHFSGDAYPALLCEIPDPPPVLYYRGPKPSDARAAVAIVGSRRPTRYGRRVAHRMAREVASAGVTVVSGLAYGIDTCAHEGALESGSSAAVLACGLDRPYPRTNRRLFDALAASGGVTSEYPPGTEAYPFHFPARNRIVTGMARAVIIVEGAHRSGSLISARLALEQGRELFAVPGNIDSPTSRGTNALLRDGCPPLLEAADVLQALGIAHVGATTASPSVALPKDPDACAVLAVLGSEPVHVDDVVDACRLDGARVLELLTTLELAGLAERMPGGLFVSLQRADFSRQPPQPRRTA